MSEVDAQSGDGEIGICHVCGLTFKTQVAMSEHLMVVHAEDELPTSGGDREPRGEEGETKAP